VANLCIFAGKLGKSGGNRVGGLSSDPGSGFEHFRIPDPDQNIFSSLIPDPKS
jgi:hypothetical protein